MHKKLSWIIFVWYRVIVEIKMYTKEELEGMKYKQLKSIAKQKKISRRLTTKREIIDSLLNFDQEENLDDITVTLLNNSEIEENSPAMESEVKENLYSGKENEPAIVGRTRSARRIFPTPRMTVFQMYDADDQPIVIHTSQSRKGNFKYFDEPESAKMSKMDEDLNTSSEASGTSDTHSVKNNKSVTQLHDNYNEIQNSKLLSSRKKKKRTSTRNFTPRQPVSLVNSPSLSSVVTRRTRKSNYVNNDQEANMFDDIRSTHHRSHRKGTSLFGNDMKMENVNGDNEAKESKPLKDKKKMFSNNRVEEQELLVTSNKKTRRRFPKPRMTINEMCEADDQSPVISTRQSSKDADKESHENENLELQIVKKAHINLVANNGKQQGRYFKNSSNDTIMKDGNSEDIVTEASVLISDAEDKDTQLNETFDIEQQSINIDVLEVHKSGCKNKMSPAKLRRSARRKTVLSLPKGSNNMSTLEDAQEVNPQLNETFEIEEQNDVTSDFEVSSRKIRKSVRKRAIASSRDENKKVGTSNWCVGTSVFQMKEPTHDNEISFQMQKDNKNGEKRRSRSCEPETSDKNYSKLQFFSPLPKSVTKHENSHKKGTPLKNTRIPKFVKKMPDFQNIHKKQFEKMESLVDNHQRKLQRAKGLLSPLATKNTVMVFSAQPTVKQSPIRKPATQIPGLRIPTKLNGRYDAQNILRDHNAPSSAHHARNNMYNKQHVKEMISRKLPIHDRRENVRQESRTAIRGVRLNRRFELQMACRNIN